MEGFGNDPEAEVFLELILEGSSGCRRGAVPTPAIDKVCVLVFFVKLKQS